MFNFRSPLIFFCIFLSFNSFSNEYISNPEDMLRIIISEISDENIDQAINEVDKLISIHPNFKIAYVIKGDLLKAKSSSINNFGAVITENKNKVIDLKKELDKRLKLYNSDLTDVLIKKYQFYLDKKIEYLLFVDVNSSRLFVYQNISDNLEFLSDYYVSIGKNGYGKQSEGDKRTPIGVYFLQGKINQLLPDKYGDGAFGLNYPNSFDILNNKTGHGIWVHGVPSNTYSRPPTSSDGCIVLSNRDLNNLTYILEKKDVPIIISDRSIKEIESRNQVEIDQSQNSFKYTFDDWRGTWESINYENYINFYSKSFRSNKKNYDTWSHHKKNVFKKTSFISLKISNMSFFEYPHNDEIMLVKFDQNYESNLLKNKMSKQQLWKKENGYWKIILEDKF